MGYELAQKTCIEDGCEETDIKARGMCSNCYERHRYRGEYTKICPVVGCERLCNRRGLCASHREEFTTGPMGYCMNPGCKEPIKPRACFGANYATARARDRRCVECRRETRGRCPIKNCLQPTYAKGPCLDHRAEHSAAGMRWCTHPKCWNPLKPVTRFAKSAKGYGGRESWCGDCHAQYSAVRRAVDRGATRRNERSRAYGLSIEEFDNLLAAQDGCALAACGVKWDSVRNPRLDHDHACCDKEGSCGRCVRQFLCNRCNTMLGRYHDDPIMMSMAIGRSKTYPDELLRSGIAYLEFWNSEMVRRGVRERDIMAETYQWMMQQVKEILAPQ